MAQGSSGASYDQVKYQCIAMIKDVRVTMKYLLGKLRGTESIFHLKARYGSACVKLSPQIIHKAIVYLRIQYLDLFVTHFPITCINENYRKLSLHTEFATEVKNLRTQFDNNQTTKYFLTIKHLLHLTEVMARGTFEFQILWYNCWLCGIQKHNHGTMKYPVVDCLAKMHNVPSNVVYKVVGFPLKCTCKTLMYHCNVYESDSSE